MSRPRRRPYSLGIPTIKARVVQSAVVLEPIFEAELQPDQYVFPPGPSCLSTQRSLKSPLAFS